MAVDSPVLYNNAWVYLRDSLGSQSGGADKQKHNAEPDEHRQNQVNSECR